MRKPKAYSYIRFSTPEQQKGDSLRRQLEASTQYAIENELELDTSLTMHDLGFSAFHGQHREKGSLGHFLHLIEDNKIENGSYLLIENIDRLSREKPMDALRIFDKIIRADVKVVNLQSGIVFSEESLARNPGELYFLIGEMIRANQESERKSIMLKKSWQNKRELAAKHGKKLTAKCPLWIKLSEDKSKFILIPEIRDAIELIYKMKLQGYGSGRIEKELNQKEGIYKPGISKRNKTGGWRKSYINKLLLNNRQLIGEYQPYELIDGKRKPVGQIIKDYYPKAIDEELFYQVQSLISENRKRSGNAGGKTGKASNLFTHVAKCGFCGGAMHYINKGDGPKGGRYLQCDISHRKLSDQNNNLKCEARTIGYQKFENLFFSEFEELNIAKFLPSNTEIQIKVNTIYEKIRANRGKIEQLHKGIEGLLDTARKRPSDYIYHAIHADEKNIKKLEEINIELVEEMNILKQKIKEIESQAESLKKIRNLLGSSLNEKQQIDLRIKVRGEIQHLFKWIRIYPVEDYQKKLERKKKAYQALKNKIIHLNRQGEKRNNEAIKLNALKSTIEELEANMNGTNLRNKNKEIETIRFHFNGIKKYGVINPRSI